MQFDDLELIIQSSDDGTIYDVSKVASEIKTSKKIDNSAGKCTFSIDTNVNKIRFPMGSTVSLRIKQNGKWYGKFFGYIFGTEPNINTVSITAYNQLKYLSNNESYVLTGTTMEKLIKLIGNDFKLRIGTIEGMNYILPERIEDNKSLGDIIQRAIDFTLQGTKHLFVLRDEFGYLCCRDVAKLVTNIIIGDGSLLTTDFDYSESIDSETYNSVKLYKDNKDTGKREVYIAKDSNNIKRWGMLQDFESIDENVTDAQAREKAVQILNLHNKVYKELSLPCKGVLQLEPGDGIRLQLSSIPGVTFNQNAYISSIEDTFENGLHTMDLEVVFE